MMFSKDEMEVMVQVHGVEIRRLEALLETDNIYQDLITRKISMLKDIVARCEKELCTEI
jgi:hypothetical protein